MLACGCYIVTNRTLESIRCGLQDPMLLLVNELLVNERRNHV